MINVPVPVKKIIIKTVNILFLFSLAVSFHTAAAASDLSDATTLREKCESEARVLEIPARNFGSESDKAEFQKGMDILKSAKIKMAQSKYIEAKTLYNEYLKLQSTLYKSLAAAYIARTDAVISEITTELVDFIDNKKVDQYFKLATQNLNDAKSSSAGERYKTAIDLCRNAKSFAIETYKLAGKEVPEKYKKDVKDINREIF